MLDALISLFLNLNQRFGKRYLIALAAFPVAAIVIGLIISWVVAGYILLALVAFILGFALIEWFGARVEAVKLRKSDPQGYMLKQVQENINQFGITAVDAQRKAIRKQVVTRKI